MSYREQFFPDLEVPVYLNNAAVAPLNQRAKDAAQWMLGRYAKLGVTAWAEGNVVRERLRSHLAKLIGAEAHEIGLVGNTSQGLLNIALEYPWQKGDSLVVFKDEFPANVLPWRIAAERFQLNLHMLDLDDLDGETEAFRDVMAEKPRLLAISWVQYQTGRVIDLARLSRIRAQYDVHIAVDGIQGLVPLTCDLRKTPIDFFACGGHKWLLSPEGVGFLYVKDGHMETFRAAQAGWLSTHDPARFLFEGDGLVDYAAPFRNDVKRYEMATMNSTGFAAMEASVALILEIGADTISRHICDLAAFCREGLLGLGLTPGGPNSAAGIASFKPSRDDLGKFSQALKARGIVLATPDGYLRASPHIYNTKEDIQTYLAALAAILSN